MAKQQIFKKRANEENGKEIKKEIKKEVKKVIKKANKSKQPENEIDFSLLLDIQKDYVR